MKRHWTTAQSPEERASLAAFDAWINPPKGVSAFDAAAAGERIPIGPVPTRDEDTALEKLLETFNRQRGDKTDAATIARLIPPIEAHYRRLVAETWKLLWRCRDRELSNSEAPSVDRRWEEDCRAYKDHMKWQRQDGRTRTRQTARQAAQMMKERERAQQLLDAEEACEDSLKMLPHILANRAVFGKVVSVDREHKERGPKNMVRRPLIVLESPDPCLIPRGKKLYWTRLPKMACELVGVQHLKDGRSRVTLKVLTGTPKELPSPNSDACFSVLTTDVFFSQPLPREAPWPHAALASVPLSIEDS
ncbi:MAG: hypothetical protein FJW37_09335 [Acidobacteria bacterium]|nr:hypothetical protein [Acidobacteriota bacterium]